MTPHNGLQVAQDRETPVQAGRVSAFSWRYAYARSADTRTSDDPGQDYLTFRYDDTTFAFALCDGVSQSFFGDLSARLLGDALLDWVWNDLPAGTDSHNIQAALSGKLQALTAHASELVREHPLPKDIPKMLRDVLEQKRAIGSESTFVCGRIDLPGAGSSEGRAVMAWMGDSRLRFWGASGERSAELGDKFITSERWSTHKGAVESEPHVFVGPVQRDGHTGLRSIMVYSDGLSALDEVQPPSDSELNDMIARSAQTAVSDDISFLQVSLEGVKADSQAALPTPNLEQVSADAQAAPPALQAQAPKSDKPIAPPSAPSMPHLPAPDIASARNEGGRMQLRWTPVQGASHYRVEVQNEAEQYHEWQAQDTAWTSPPLKPGIYRVRVSAHSGEQHKGEWSKPSRVQIFASGAGKASESTSASPTTPAIVTVPQRTSPSQASPSKATAHAAPAQTETTTTSAQATSELPLPTTPVGAYQTQAGARKRGAPPWAMIAIPLVLLVLLGVGAFAFFSAQSQTQQQAAVQATAAAQATAQQQRTAAQRSTAQAQAVAQSQLAGTATAQALLGQAAEATRQSQATAQAIAVATEQARADQPEGTPLTDLTTRINATNATDLRYVPGLREQEEVDIIKVVFDRHESQEVIAASRDGTIWLWRVSDGALLHKSPRQPVPINSIAVDGNTLVVGLADGTVQLWNKMGQAPSTTFIAAHTKAVMSVAFSPDGQAIASGSDDGTAKLWGRDGTLLKTLTADQRPVLSVTFSSDGQTLATGSADGTLRLWQVRDGQPIRTLIGHAGAVNSVEFSPDGQTLTSASSDGTIKLWNVSDGTLKQTLAPRQGGGPVSSVTFSPRGDILASGAEDGVVRMWDVRTGNLLQALTTDSLGPVRSVTFSPDGVLLLAGSDAQRSAGEARSMHMWAINPSAIIATTVAGSQQATSTAQARIISTQQAGVAATEEAGAIPTATALAMKQATFTAEAQVTGSARPVQATATFSGPGTATTPPRATVTTALPTGASTPTARRSPVNIFGSPGATATP